MGSYNSGGIQGNPDLYLCLNCQGTADYGMRTVALIDKLYTVKSISTALPNHT